MTPNPPPASAAPATAILLGHCPDRKGINAAITRFVADHGGNILDYDQHVDAEAGVFFVRIAWDLAGFGLARGAVAAAFRPIAEAVGMRWELHFTDRRPRMAVMVSRLGHCLYDLLARWQSGEWPVDIPVVLSNHPDLGDVVRQYGLRFELFPIAAANKREQEEREIALLRAAGADFVVLARYMQILGPAFVEAFPSRILNIHHSFLPAFAGARPYHAAYERGVKIIGATSHYVTAELDTGPIVEQDIIRVSHKDSVAELVRKGKDLEKIVLARAVWHHLQHKILVYGNKTVVFE